MKFARVLPPFTILIFIKHQSRPFLTISIADGARKITIK